MNVAPDMPPRLEAHGIHVRHGPGCDRCLTGAGPEQGNRCAACGTVHAVRQVDVQAFDGEVLGIVGESGSGKSSLLRTLALEQAPSAGMYLIREDGPDDHQNRFDASDQAIRRLRNETIGLVRQHAHETLRMRLSATGNIAETMLAAGHRHVGRMRERAAGLLDDVSIARDRHLDAPATFSGGMQQRVQIARAIANNPPVLLLDEVTTGLDLSVQARVLDLIQRIQRERQMTVILVSHDLAVVRMLADRTLVMRHGQVIEHGLTDRILEDPHMPYTQELVQSLL